MAYTAITGHHPIFNTTLSPEERVAVGALAIAPIAFKAADLALDAFRTIESHASSGIGALSGGLRAVRAAYNNTRWASEVGSVAAWSSMSCRAIGTHLPLDFEL